MNESRLIDECTPKHVGNGCAHSPVDKQVVSDGPRSPNPV